MRLLRLLAIALLMLGSSAALAADPAQAIAARLLDQLDAGNYAGAEAGFTPEMAAAVPAATLKAIWESLPAQMGAANGRGAAQTTTQQGMSVVVIRLRFANGELDTQTVVDGQGRIAGFRITPAAPPPAAAPAADAGFHEIEFSIPAKPGALPGTLAMPDGTGPFPAVVLVHGSGPQDRDETIGPNRPFLDIARGLAAQGIAVLRYEKRSKARPQDLAGDSFTVDDETTHDAVAAVAALATAPGIDARHLFVLGHSQGGMLAPRIARQSGKLAGLILLAAPARSLLTILPEQNRYLFLQDGQISSEEQAFLDKLDAQIAAVRGSGEVAAKDSPLGQPAHYWRSFEAIHPVADARALTLPILLLQGGRDFQVTGSDWQLWKAGLQGARFSFRDYPALNHLGIAGEGPGTLQEYQQPGHVSAQLIDDVAGWIKAQP
ncbi:alpha/beta fold hydrolase [Stenotrophomonas sp. YIM B06876]|uniref:alpha/beta hydrolase n=1 Tax=Stenotrophomonas sp. YIM B06876 TaxID=3060211 RepID=UPI002739ACA1|nr:alpha/beta fold hydrolase [Stenotrophomonas sp. YIM B06876]